MKILLFCFSAAILWLAPTHASERHTWTLPGGETVTGSVEMADARGVHVKREDGNPFFLPAGDMTAGDRATLERWQKGEAVPAAFEDPDVEITIKTLAGMLAYDRGRFSVPPGARVILTLANEEELQHNLVVLNTPGKDAGQALALTAMDLGAEGMEREWIPQSENMLAASRMANPHEMARIYFRAPETEASYAYVCTFPGHAMIMNGLMRVGDPPETGSPTLVKGLRYRLYEGSWQKLPDFDALSPVEEGEVGEDRLIDVKSFELKERFGAVFTGTLVIGAAGDYAFALTSDDGSRVVIDGKEVVAMDGVHPAGAPKTGLASLEPGDHQLRIEYFEQGGGEELYVSFSGPDLEETMLTRGKPRGGSGSDTVGIPIFPPAGEALIYRNFIDGVGGARGIGVGYSEGVHLAYDAGNGRIALMWKGGFIDAKRHWTNRGTGYQPPSGTAVQIDPRGQMLAVLSDPQETWPTADFVDRGKSRLYSAPERSESGYQFGGYELNEKRQPTFLWSWNGIEVRDFPRPDGKRGFVRTLTFSGAAPRDGTLLFRAAPSAINADLGKLEIVNAGGVHIDSDIRAPIDLSSGRAVVTIHYTLK